MEKSLAAVESFLSDLQIQYIPCKLNFKRST